MEMTKLRPIIKIVNIIVYSSGKRGRHSKRVRLSYLQVAYKSPTVNTSPTPEVAVQYPITGAYKIYPH